MKKSGRHGALHILLDQLISTTDFLLHTFKPNSLSVRANSVWPVSPLKCNWHFEVNEQKEVYNLCVYKDTRQTFSHSEDSVVEEH